MSLEGPWEGEGERGGASDFVFLNSLPFTGRQYCTLFIGLSGAKPLARFYRGRHKFRTEDCQGHHMAKSCGDSDLGPSDPKARSPSL